MVRGFPPELFVGFRHTRGGWFVVVRMLSEAVAYPGVKPRERGDVTLHFVQTRLTPGEEEEKKGGENARIRVLLLKLCPADPEVWRVRCFVVGSLPVFVFCDMPL